MDNVCIIGDSINVRSVEWAGVWMDGCMSDSKDGYTYGCMD